MATSSGREAVTPPGVWSNPRLSPAIRAGGLVFVSGTVSLDRDGEVVGQGNIRAQTEHVFQTIRTVLEAAGSGMDRLVKTTTFLTDVSHYPAFNEVRGKYLPQPPPASTTVVVKELVRPELLVEVKAIATG